MKFAVVGSRTITLYSIVKDILATYPITQIISGGATGVDKLAARYSTESELVAPKIFLPDWKQYGRRAGFLRNIDIVDSADYVIAIWDGQSKGTLHSIRYAQKINKPVYIWIVNIEQQTARLDYQLLNSKR